MLTLCRFTNSDTPTLREMHVDDVKTSRATTWLPDILQDQQGKLGLISAVIKNKLDQPVGYRVLIEGYETFCKSTVAEKYFKVVKK